MRTWLQKAEWNHRSRLRIPTFNPQIQGHHFQQYQKAALLCSQCSVLLDVLNKQLESKGASLIYMKETLLVADLQWAM